jgi:tetratricopeptide (TPR) repeat protein
VQKHHANVPDRGKSVNQVLFLMSNAKFWVSMAVFQTIFGLVVFAATRQYYIHEATEVITGPPLIREPSLTSLDNIRRPNPLQAESTNRDPDEVSRLADEFFTKRQFDRAADLYEQLLTYDPNDVDTYNNLGLTLHYLGRSTEALSYLNKGVAVDPRHQRIWLTLGYVNSQLGNIERARTALTTAVQMGADNEIGQAATRMLENFR